MGDRIHRRHRAGSNCAGYHVRDHCAHPDLPNPDLRIVTVAPSNWFFIGDSRSTWHGLSVFYIRRSPLGQAQVGPVSADNG